MELERPETEDVVKPDTPWVTIVWNDPVNLMSYVAYVFQTYSATRERSRRSS